MFYYLCYEGSVDLDQINDLAARHALEVQISEFGQIPKQLFDKPHVPKATSAAARTSTKDGNLCGGGAIGAISCMDKTNLCKGFKMIYF